MANFFRVVIRIVLLALGLWVVSHSVDGSLTFALDTELPETFGALSFANLSFSGLVFNMEKGGFQTAPEADATLIYQQAAVLPVFHLYSKEAISPVLSADLPRDRLYLLVHLFLSLAMVMLFIFLLSERKKAKDQRSKTPLSQPGYSQGILLTEQVNLLTKAISDLHQINQKLEKLDKGRTHQMNQQRSNLMDFSFFCSHILTAPVARVLGLVYLMKTLNDFSSKSEVLEMLEYESLQLNKLISDMCARLEEQNLSANLNSFDQDTEEGER